MPAFSSRSRIIEASTFYAYWRMQMSFSLSFIVVILLIFANLYNSLVLSKELVFIYLMVMLKDYIAVAALAFPSSK